MYPLIIFLFGLFFCINTAAQELTLDSVSARYIQNKAIKLDDLTHLPQKDFSFLSDYRVILLGESHGTNEMPEMALGLIKQSDKPVLLAIEVWHSEQECFERFMHTGDLEILKNSPFFKHTPQYGVGSRAMVHLLQTVRELPHAAVLCFDPYHPESNNFLDPEAVVAVSEDRDIQMAQNTIKKYQENGEYRVIVLTGSLHASTQKHFLLNTEYRPMGYWLSHLKNSPFTVSDILSILAKYEKGSLWGAMLEEGRVVHGIHKLDCRDIYSKALDWEHYFLRFNRIHEGYNAVFFTRALTPSPPLNIKS